MLVGEDTVYSAGRALKGSPGSKVKSTERTPPASYRDRVLSQFEPEIANALIQFGKRIASQPVEDLIFMARKSYCVYELLVAAGVPRPTGHVLSDRVLDFDLRHFAGRRVSLIDDSLNLGTTLEQARRKLVKAGAAVDVHVFIRNRDRRPPPTKDVPLTTCELELSTPAVRRFCAQAVRALSVAPRPYIVDFPILEEIRAFPGDLDSLANCPDWEYQDLTSRLQERWGVACATLFPRGELLGAFRKSLGPSLAGVLELAKVRVFSQPRRDVDFLRAVPLVTLSPLRVSDLHDLVDTAAVRLGSKAGDEFRDLVRSADGAEGAQRVLQYVLSLALGEFFTHSISQRFGSKPVPDVSAAEMDAHFGHWRRDSFRSVIGSLHAAFCEGLPTNPSTVSTAALPTEAQTYAERLVAAAEEERAVSDGASTIAFAQLVADVGRVFTRLYEVEEQGAAECFERMGTDYLDLPPAEAPHRDRLLRGIPWRTLLTDLTSRFRLSGDIGDVARRLSLVLDRCNDLGVAVPITVVEGGVVYRAWRHGEDVKFLDGEADLALEATKAFLAASDRQAMPRIAMEKLLVLLVRIGAEQGFLDAVYGEHWDRGYARIEFSLHGAVAKISQDTSDDPYPSLTDHLVRLGCTATKISRHMRSVISGASSAHHRPARPGCGPWYSGRRGRARS